MFKNVKISTKLMGISIASVLGLVMLSATGIKGSLTGIEALETIYEKNVIPENEVKEAKEKFDTILDDLIYVTSEFLPTGQARERVYTLRKEVDSFFEEASNDEFYNDPYLKKNLNEAYDRYKKI